MLAKHIFDYVFLLSAAKLPKAIETFSLLAEFFNLTPLTIKDALMSLPIVYITKQEVV